MPPTAVPGGAPEECAHPGSFRYSVFFKSPNPQARVLFGFLKDTYRKKRYGSPIIVVSGLPRSGTSMMMKMLAAGGLDVVTDEIRTADEDNPKGYFEYEQVKELDKGGDKGWLEGCRGKVVLPRPRQPLPLPPRSGR